MWCFKGRKGVTPYRFLKSKWYYSLFDSGVPHACINEEMADEIETPTPLCTPMSMSTASATTFMEIKYRAALDFYYEDIRLSDEFYVIPGLSGQVITGAVHFAEMEH